jgi:hypothetical protein
MGSYAQDTRGLSLMSRTPLSADLSAAETAIYSALCAAGMSKTAAHSAIVAARVAGTSQTVKAATPAAPRVNPALTVAQRATVKVESHTTKRGKQAARVNIVLDPADVADGWQSISGFGGTYITHKQPTA